jgi:hypothetical protein
VLRRIFGLERNGVLGVWIETHSEELHNFYYSPTAIRMIISRRIKCRGHVACMREKRNGCRILVGKPEGRRPLGRLGHGREDSIKMDLVEVR